MTDDEKAPDNDEESNEQKDEIRPLEDETTSDDKTCPECGVPIYNLRRNCPNCGYEYKDEDYDEESIGSEFTAGTEVPDDEIGEKIKEDVSGEEKTSHNEEKDEDAEA